MSENEIELSVLVCALQEEEGYGTGYVNVYSHLVALYPCYLPCRLVFDQEKRNPKKIRQHLVNKMLRFLFQVSKVPINTLAYALLEET